MFDCYFCILAISTFASCIFLQNGTVSDNFIILYLYTDFFWHTNLILNSLSIHLIIHSRISKFEAVWINSSSTIVITYKTYWHNDISAVKALFSQHLFTCNLCKIVWKYDLFGRHVKTFMRWLSLLFFAHHVSSLVWSTSGPFKGFGL